MASTRRTQRYGVTGALVLAAMIAMFLISRERPTSPTSVELVVTVSDSAGLRILSLSHSPNDVARGLIRSMPLESSYSIGGPDSEVLGIQDAAAFGDNVAIADGWAHHILLVNSEGKVYDSLGREGEGPGEFKFPYVVEASDEALLVVSSGALLTSITLEGKNTVGVRRSPIPGDWASPFFRRPFSVWDRPTQISLEDATRRYTGWQGRFMIQLQDDERLGEVTDLDAPEVRLISADMALTRFDTLETFVGAPLIPAATLASAKYQNFERPVYSAMPLVASGQTWLAVGHGNRNAVEIRCGAPPHVCAYVRWPRDTRAVTDQDKLEYVRWGLRYELEIATGPHLRWLHSLTGRALSGVLKKQANITPFASDVPQVVDLLGAADCLFIAGFNPSDSYRGTSAKWIVLDLNTGQVKTVAIPGNGPRVRDVSPLHIYATYKGESMADELRAMRLSEPLCATNAGLVGPP
ncbi:MAG: hypothetical protein OEZ65_14345 [Gemmatimonadota bacterium]|nr:hypothetical protein [Gemmatimonadota bacterium]